MSADSISGVWNYALDLTREMKAFHVDVALALLGDPLSREKREQVRELSNLEVFESEAPLDWVRDPWRDLQNAGDWLLKLERELQPDLVHLNHYSHGALPWKKPHLVVAHSDAFSWWSSVRGGDPPQEWDNYRGAVRDCLAGADLVIAPSRSALDDLRSTYGPLPGAKIIPNGRDLSRLNELQKESMILSVGDLGDEAKNIRLLDSFSADLPWPIVIVGSSKQLDGNTIELGGIQATGEIPFDQLIQLFGKAAIYALPAKYEPLGTSVLEAAQCGCALVLSDIPSLRENWSHAALFADPREPASFRDAIRYLIENENARRNLGRSAKIRARFFSSRRMSTAYWQEYSRLFHPRSPRARDSERPSGETHIPKNTGEMNP